MLSNLYIRIKGKILKNKKRRTFGKRLSKDSKLAASFSFNISETAQVCFGSNCHLDGHWQIYGQLKVGSHVSFRRGTLISVTSKIQIGDNVFAAENVFISDNDGHPLDAEFRKNMTESPPGSKLWKPFHSDVASSPVIIENNVWLGKNVIILKGVTIGRNSIVGAGSVVVKSIPSNTVVAGNPARVIKNL